MSAGPRKTSRQHTLEKRSEPMSDLLWIRRHDEYEDLDSSARGMEVDGI